MRGKLLALGFIGSIAAVPAVSGAADHADQAVPPSDPAVLVNERVEGRFTDDASSTLHAAVSTASHGRAAVGHRDVATTAGPPGPAALAAIAQCESGGDPTARSGPYGGLFQFDQQTWESVGGSGDPAAAPAQEQEMRASLLYQQRGLSAWPVCGSRA